MYGREVGRRAYSETGIVGDNVTACAAVVVYVELDSSKNIASREMWWRARALHQLLWRGRGSPATVHFDPLAMDVATLRAQAIDWGAHELSSHQPIAR